MSEHLFIGGKLDGQVLNVDVSSPYQKIYDCNQLYRKQTIEVIETGVRTHHFTFFVLDSLSHPEAVSKLLAGYLVKNDTR